MKNPAKIFFFFFFEGILFKFPYSLFLFMSSEEEKKLIEFFKNNPDYEEKLKSAQKKSERVSKWVKFNRIMTYVGSIAALIGFLLIMTFL
jgi:hypothetical protein